MKSSVRVLIFLMILFTLSSCGSKRESMALKMVHSEMTRCPDASYLDEMGGVLKWNYTTGLELLSFIDVSLRYSDTSIYQYAEKWYDSIIDENGVIHSYKESNYNVDHICPGRALFYLYSHTGNEKYLKAIETLRHQLDNQPRTSQGGFFHKKIYPHQMWLDGLYMAQPFYAQYTSLYESAPKRDSLYKDIINHFLVAAEHTYDPSTGLYRHAWDESREMFWSDSITGQSQHAWGRAMGWLVMGIVDVLDYIPEEIESRNELITILRNIYQVLPKYADSSTGMWYQVLDSPGREGNYLEGTCSAMFSYALLKGVRMGYLDAGLASYAKETYRSFVKYFIVENEDGTISIKDCCAVAGLGGKENRSGDYDYYINEKRRSNDAKGVGPFIWASLEYENCQ